MYPTTKQLGVYVCQWKRNQGQEQDKLLIEQDRKCH